MTTAKQAKVAATGVGGALATLAAFFWQGQFPPPSPLNLGVIETGLFVTVVSFLAGPLVRKYERMAGHETRDDLIAQMHDNQRKLSRAITDLEQQLREAKDGRRTDT